LKRTNFTDIYADLWSQTYRGVRKAVLNCFILSSQAVTFFVVMAVTYAY